MTTIIQSCRPHRCKYWVFSPTGHTESTMILYLCVRTRIAPMCPSFYQVFGFRHLPVMWVVCSMWTIPFPQSIKLQQYPCTSLELSFIGHFLASLSWRAEAELRKVNLETQFPGNFQINRTLKRWLLLKNKQCLKTKKSGTSCDPPQEFIACKGKSRNDVEQSNIWCAIHIPRPSLSYCISFLYKKSINIFNVYLIF